MPWDWWLPIPSRGVKNIKHKPTPPIKRRHLVIWNSWTMKNSGAHWSTCLSTLFRCPTAASTHVLSSSHLYNPKSQEQRKNVINYSLTHRRKLAHGSSPRPPAAQPPPPLAWNLRPPSPIPTSPSSHQSPVLLRCHYRRRPWEDRSDRPRERRHRLQGPAQAHCSELRAQGGPRRLRPRRPPSGVAGDGDPPIYGLAVCGPVSRHLPEALRWHRDFNGVHGRRYLKNPPGNQRHFLGSGSRWRRRSGAERPQLPP